MRTDWRPFFWRRGTRVSTFVLVLVAVQVVWLGQETRAVEDRSERNAARRPHDDLPPGRRDHAAAVIDGYFGEYWASADVSPAPSLDDGAFLRRASLALNGVPATREELIAFVSDPSPSKRSRKVEELLTRSRYADYWGFRLRTWITDLREVKGQGVSLRNLYWYTREAMAENHSWKRIAQDLLTSQGNLQNDGSVNFGLYFDVKPNEFADAAARFFLGSNLACAQCHDHPSINQWKRETYWGLAAYFARARLTRIKPEALEKVLPGTGRSPRSVSTLPGGDPAIDGGGGEERAIVDFDAGTVTMPDPEKPKPMFPTPLGGAARNESNGTTETLREQLVAWMTASENPYFARAAVNRFCIEIVGRGFVDRVDGFSPVSEVRHERLLDQLAGRFAQEGYDVKWLLRTIVLSRLFDLDHEKYEVGPTAETTFAETWHAAPRRRLNSDQWCDSVLRVTGEEKRIFGLTDEIAPLLAEEHNARVAKRERLTDHAIVTLEKGKYARLARRLRVPTFALQPVAHDLHQEDRVALRKKRQAYISMGKTLEKFRGQARTSMSPASEALMRMNGGLVAWGLDHGGASGEIAAMDSAGERLEAVFETVLNRAPTQEENRRLEESLARPSSEAVANLLWALMQTTEFQTY